jgi:hypothetical protein
LRARHQQIVTYNIMSLLESYYIILSTCNVKQNPHSGDRLDHTGLQDIFSVVLPARGMTYPQRCVERTILQGDGTGSKRSNTIITADVLTATTTNLPI